MTASSARPASNPNRPPPTNEMKNSFSPDPMSSSRAVPIIPSKTANSAIAAASLRRAAPSTRRVQGACAHLTRKTTDTAAGPVVDTTQHEQTKQPQESHPTYQKSQTQTP